MLSQAGMILLYLILPEAAATNKLEQLQRSLRKAALSADCPVSYPQLSMTDIMDKLKQPYILGGHTSSCQNCKSELSRATFCYFQQYGKFGWDKVSNELHDQMTHQVSAGDPPTCPKYDQQLLLEYWTRQAAGGSATAHGFLTFTPCHLWPYLQGRTLW